MENLLTINLIVQFVYYYIKIFYLKMQNDRKI